MKAHHHLAASIALGLLVIAAPARPDITIGAPDLPPSQVDAAGDLHEDWGVVALRLEQPAGAAVSGQRHEMSPQPDLAARVITTVSAGPVTLTSSAYRAPIWPDGVDVLTARLENTADREVPARLQLVLPEQLDVGERIATLGGRPVLALPQDAQPQRRERSWGGAGGDVAMPGWAHPVGECDPAFCNIRAGMGGVPIIYRFAVPAGAKRTVVLGLCESHHVEARQRPLLLYVEGAPRAEVDPIAAWGRHVPGCLAFDAADADNDGRLQIVVAPHPQAVDRNPILNVIWVFSPDVYVNTDEVLRGKLSSVAEHYVDVGGERDQLLYESGTLTYDLTLPAGAGQELTFLVACAGASVPNPETMAWTPESLRKAAEDVWGDFAARTAAVPAP